MSQARPVHRVALRGDDDGASGLDDAAVTVTDARDAEAIVAIGEEALFEAALSGPAVPLVPVEVGGGHHAVSKRSLGAVGDALTSGAYRVVEHPVLGVSVDGERVARAVMDATLVTAEPARISEFAVASGDEELDAVRADGVVVATPLGSSGYARAAGGTVVAPDAGLSIVPIAPFETNADTWAVEGPVSLTVERDESEVSLYADDEFVRGVDPHVPVTTAPVDGFEAIRLLDDG